MKHRSTDSSPDSIQKSSSQGAGVLYLVATPIGNLGDMSQRAVQTLQSVDLIAAEDTRHSGKLLNHFNINTSSFPLHDHNERQKAKEIVAKIEQGNSIALISDAGTPLVSDPGYNLVQSCIEAGLEVQTIPGPCALIAALSVSGLASDRFSFCGFLPAKSKGRRDALSSLKHLTHTLIFYESPHRIEGSLDDFMAELGAERQGALVRELTKTYETVIRGSLSEIRAALDRDENQRRGEMVLLVAGAEEVEVEITDLSEQMQWLAKELDRDLPTKRAAELVATLSGLKKKEVYRWLVDNAED